MATKAKVGKGLKLQRGDGGGVEAFTTIAEVLNASGPSGSREMITATSMDSTDVEVLLGMRDNGEVTFACHLVDSDTQQQGLYDDMDDAVLRNFKMVLPNHSTEASKSTRLFAAYVQDIGEEFDFGGVMARNVTLRISGAVTRTFAAAE